MCSQKKFRFIGLMTLACFIMVSGCASPPKTLDPSVSGPQLIVNPECIRLGVVKMRDTNIVFEGSGFQTKPGDSILITLTGPNETKVIAAEAPIQQNGTFKATVPPLTKIMEFLRAEVTFNEKFENVVVVSQPPISKGVYTAKAESMISKQTAETKLTVKGKTVINSLKDWIGKLKGKIQYKESK
jgi:leucyl-tRNA synthetase